MGNQEEKMHCFLMLAVIVTNVERCFNNLIILNILKSGHKTKWVFIQFIIHHVTKHSSLYDTYSDNYQNDQYAYLYSEFVSCISCTRKHKTIQLKIFPQNK